MLIGENDIVKKPVLQPIPESSEEASLGLALDSKGALLARSFEHKGIKIANDIHVKDFEAESNKSSHQK